MTPHGHHGVLAAVARAFADRQTVVIGAVAMQWHFPSFRGTLDLDLCIAIDLDEHERAVALPRTWQRLGSPPHRWRTDDGQLLDILPAADQVLAAGSIRWPDGTVMDMTGLDLAMRDHHRFDASLSPNVTVASRRALFLAKVAAWLDRPLERQKDLGDLALLLDDYVDDLDPRRFDEPVLDRLDWSDRPAALLGLDLRAICTPRHRERVLEFVRRVGTSGTREQSWMLLAAPPGWHAADSILAARFSALVTGLGAS